MPEQEDDELKRVWNQRKIPVVLRRTGKGELLRVRLPSHLSNHERDFALHYWWLRHKGKRIPVWDPDRKFWELPKAWFNDFVDRSLTKYGNVYIIQPYRSQEKCSPSCQSAEGHECECSCMGENHGTGNDGSWFEISDAFATRWNDREIACRLLTRKTSWTLPKVNSQIANSIG